MSHIIFGQIFDLTDKGPCEKNISRTALAWVLIFGTHICVKVVHDLIKFWQNSVNI